MKTTDIRYSVCIFDGRGRIIAETQKIDNYNRAFNMAVNGKKSMKYASYAQIYRYDKSNYSNYWEFILQV